MASEPQFVAVNASIGEPMEGIESSATTAAAGPEPVSTNNLPLQTPINDLSSAPISDPSGVPIKHLAEAKRIYENRKPPFVTRQNKKMPNRVVLANEAGKYPANPISVPLVSQQWSTKEAYYTVEVNGEAVIINSRGFSDGQKGGSYYRAFEGTEDTFSSKPFAYQHKDDVIKRVYATPTSTPAKPVEGASTAVSSEEAETTTTLTTVEFPDDADVDDDDYGDDVASVSPAATKLLRNRLDADLQTSEKLTCLTDAESFTSGYMSTQSGSSTESEDDSNSDHDSDGFIRFAKRRASGAWKYADPPVAEVETSSYIAKEEVSTPSFLFTNKEASKSMQPIIDEEQPAHSFGLYPRRTTRPPAKLREVVETPNMLPQKRKAATQSAARTSQVIADETHGTRLFPNLPSAPSRAESKAPSRSSSYAAPSTPTPAMTQPFDLPSPKVRSVSKEKAIEVVNTVAMSPSGKASTPILSPYMTSPTEEAAPRLPLNDLPISHGSKRVTMEDLRAEKRRKEQLREREVQQNQLKGKLREDLVLDEYLNFKEPDCCPPDLAPQRPILRDLAPRTRASAVDSPMTSSEIADPETSLNDPVAHQATIQPHSELVSTLPRSIVAKREGTRKQKPLARNLIITFPSLRKQIDRQATVVPKDQQSVHPPASVVPKVQKSISPQASVVPKFQPSISSPASVIPQAQQSTSPPQSVVPQVQQSTNSPANIISPAIEPLTSTAPSLLPFQQPISHPGNTISPPQQPITSKAHVTSQTQQSITPPADMMPPSQQPLTSTAPILPPTLEIHKQKHTILRIPLANSAGYMPIRLRGYATLESFWAMVASASGYDTEKISAILVKLDWKDERDPETVMAIKKEFPDSFEIFLECVDEAGVWREEGGRCGVGVEVVLA